jgi:spermidine/putrescine transport system permease protein
MSEPGDNAGAGDGTPESAGVEIQRAILHRGEMLRPSVIRARQAVFVSPGVIIILVLLALPCLSLFAVSFMTRGQFGDVDWTLTLANIKRLAGYGFFGWSADNLHILWRSIVVAFFTTMFCAALSYPLAFFLAARPAKTRLLWLTVLLIPFWTNLVIRTYAWCWSSTPACRPRASFRHSVSSSRGRPCIPASSPSTWG